MKIYIAQMRRFRDFFPFYRDPELANFYFLSTFKASKNVHKKQIEIQSQVASGENAIWAADHHDLFFSRSISA